MELFFIGVYVIIMGVYLKAMWLTYRDERLRIKYWSGDND